jgi:hypothetical protein
MGKTYPTYEFKRNFVDPRLAQFIPSGDATYAKKAGASR